VRRIAVAIATLALGALAAHAAAPARITLKSNAVVTQRQVTLGAIAAIASTDLATVSALAAMPVANAPRPGYTERITREELKRRIRTRTPGVRAPLSWDGADAVTIELASSLVEGTRLQALALEHARRAFEGRFRELEVMALETVADVAVPPGELTLRPRALPAGALARRVPVWIDVVVDGAFFRGVVVAVQVEAYAQGLAAAADLAAGRILAAADFTARRVDFALGAAFDARLVPEGMRLRRALRAGAVLMAADLEPRRAVARGETVTLKLHAPMVRLETRAVALGDAGVGDDIWVKRESAGEALRALVVAPGIVEVGIR